MKKALSILVILSLVMVLGGCTKYAATISVYDDFRGAVSYSPDETNPDIIGENLVPVIDLMKVQEGDILFDGDITIAKVTENKLTFKVPYDYVDEDGNIKKKFTVKRGEAIRVYEYGICDATHEIMVSYMDMDD